ncbi:LOW QUALITY PROTEIN: hypothetical protein PanWU01x14_258850 [Parasponia andersonii]|uniref:Uncharacterized protein n=1 Tax=Parasponia andersonii TaxID=3476 RepID=A0A2P5B9Q6_PARAD|nr:LOW QUALITY PROTEIN: hypothetical protein PanWU01x14_258850 [Parasponia andersonii]
MVTARELPPSRPGRHRNFSVEFHTSILVNRHRSVTLPEFSFAAPSSSSSSSSSSSPSRPLSRKNRRSKIKENTRNLLIRGSFRERERGVGERKRKRKIVCFFFVRERERERERARCVLPSTNEERE